jgi:two-component system, OmpR family, sensor histidine kinase VicK
VLVRNVQRLKTLSKDILDVTRIESDTLHLDKEYFAIKEIILEVIDNYKNEEATKNIKLEYNPSDDYNNAIVYADKNRIIQAISNLICNSIKFIDKEKEKGIISIYVKRKKDNDDDGDTTVGSENKNMAVVTVKDNGIGIDPEILPRLFTKFASKSFQGTGLGLYISKNIIEAHGGKMWTENNTDNSGKGAIFSFSLPIVN